jgi:hypothetical protein
MADAKISALPIASISSGDPVPFTKISTSVTSAINYADLSATVLKNPSVTGNASFAQNITAGSVIAVNTKVGGGIGYIAGAGSLVTQAGGGKSLSMVCNAATGQLTLNNSVMSASIISSFIVANSAMGVSDFMFIQHVSGGTLGGYTFAQSTLGDTNTLIKVKNNTNSALSEAIVLGFVVIKGAAS